MARRRGDGRHRARRMARPRGGRARADRRARFDAAGAVAFVQARVMIRFSAQALIERGLRRTGCTSRWSATCGAPSGTAAIVSSAPLRLSRRPGVHVRAHAGCLRPAGSVMADGKPKLAVWKFASCDGRQLSLLDCEDELLPLAASSRSRTSSRPAVRRSRPYDLSLVEGSITTAEDAERIRRVRESSRRLVTIGACATAGGIQALRNFADVDEFVSAVYASPSTSRRSTRRLRSARTCALTTSYTGARSTSASCSR